jgi:hypothetical protein
MTFGCLKQASVLGVPANEKNEQHSTVYLWRASQLRAVQYLLMMRIRSFVLPETFVGKIAGMVHFLAFPSKHPTSNTYDS